MNVSKVVRDALSAAISNVNSVSVSLEGSRKEPSSTETFARVKVLPAESELISIGINYRTQYQGLAQIDIIAPRSTGLTALENIAADLLTMTREPTTDTGRLLFLTVWQETVQEEPAKLRVPVLVRWVFYYDNQ